MSASSDLGSFARSCSTVGGGTPPPTKTKRVVVDFMVNVELNSIATPTDVERSISTTLARNVVDAVAKNTCSEDSNSRRRLGAPRYLAEVTSIHGNLPSFHELGSCEIVGTQSQSCSTYGGAVTVLYTAAPNSSEDSVTTETLLAIRALLESGTVTEGINESLDGAVAGEGSDVRITQMMYAGPTISAAAPIAEQQETTVVVVDDEQQQQPVIAASSGQFQAVTENGEGLTGLGKGLLAVVGVLTVMIMFLLCRCCCGIRHRRRNSRNARGIKSSSAIKSSSTSKSHNTDDSSAQGTFKLIDEEPVLNEEPKEDSSPDDKFGAASRSLADDDDGDDSDAESRDLLSRIDPFLLGMFGSDSINGEEASLTNSTASSRRRQADPIGMPPLGSDTASETANTNASSKSSRKSVLQKMGLSRSSKSKSARGAPMLSEQQPDEEEGRLLKDTNVPFLPENEETSLKENMASSREDNAPLQENEDEAEESFETSLADHESFMSDMPESSSKRKLKNPFKKASRKKVPEEPAEENSDSTILGILPLAAIGGDLMVQASSSSSSQKVETVKTLSPETMPTDEEKAHPEDGAAMDDGADTKEKSSSFRNLFKKRTASLVKKSANLDEAGLLEHEGSLQSLPTPDQAVEMIIADLAVTEKETSKSKGSILKKLVPSLGKTTEPDETELLVGSERESAEAEELVEEAFERTISDLPQEEKASKVKNVFKSLTPSRRKKSPPVDDEVGLPEEELSFAAAVPVGEAVEQTKSDDPPVQKSKKGFMKLAPSLGKKSHDTGDSDQQDTYTKWIPEEEAIETEFPEDPSDLAILSISPMPIADDSKKRSSNQKSSNPGKKKSVFKKLTPSLGKKSAKDTDEIKEHVQVEEDEVLAVPDDIILEPTPPIRMVHSTKPMPQGSPPRRGKQSSKVRILNFGRRTRSEEEDLEPDDMLALEYMQKVEEAIALRSPEPTSSVEFIALPVKQKEHLSGVLLGKRK